MKDPRDWDEDYILTNLPVGEYDWLEAKGSQVVKPQAKEVNRDLLSKAISAFANSSGGTLVLGLKQSGDSWKVDDGGIATNMGNTTTREWLEDIIPNLIESPLQIFNVYEIRQKPENSQIGAGKAVFVIQVGDSPIAPHQASDNRYYARVAGKSRPIWHRLVLDIVGRRQNPQIEMSFKYLRIIEPSSSGNYGASKGVYELEITARNTGKVLAQYVNCFIYIPKYLVDELYQTPDFIERRDDGFEYSVTRYANIERDIVDFTPQKYGPGRFEPILPGLRHSWNIKLFYDFGNQIPFFKDHELIHWEAYADNAPFASGSVALKTIQFVDHMR